MGDSNQPSGPQNPDPNEDAAKPSQGQASENAPEGGSGQSENSSDQDKSE